MKTLTRRIVYSFFLFVFSSLPLRIIEKDTFVIKNISLTNRMIMKYSKELFQQLEVVLEMKVCGWKTISFF